LADAYRFDIGGQPLDAVGIEAGQVSVDQGLTYRPGEVDGSSDSLKDRPAKP